jgi:uncharacterized protein
MRAHDVVPVSTLANGMPLSLHLHTIAGAAPGPTLGISAAIHGDEVDGVLIVRELVRSLDAARLTGTLRLLPVANPLALEAISRNTPIDNLDLNRVFPGARDGWLSEQLAHVIANEFIAGLDFYIDLHCGGTFPWVDYCYVVNDEAFSRAFLSELLYRPATMQPGTTAAVAQDRGIPTVVVEIGGGYHDQPEHIRNGVRGILNVLRRVGMLDGAPEQRPGQRLLQEIRVMRPREGGLCIPRQLLRPGMELTGTIALADIVSPYTFEVLQTMETPFERNIVVLTRNYSTRIQPGDYTFMIGNGATAMTW